MTTFIVIDNFTHQHCVIEAHTIDEAANKFAEPNLSLLKSPTIVRAKHQTTQIPNAITFVDEFTDEGWGKGCKFEGQSHPGHQVIIDVIPVMGVFPTS